MLREEGPDSFLVVGIDAGLATKVVTSTMLC
jgi:hypothetical protein